jgi:hypothetical protein
MIHTPLSSRSMALAAAITSASRIRSASTRRIVPGSIKFILATHSAIAEFDWIFRRVIEED